MHTRHILILALLIASQVLSAQEANSEQGSALLYGISVSAGYDEGQYFTGRAAISGQPVYSVQPNFALRLSRPRWETSIRYLPGFTYSTEQNSNYDRISQSLGLIFARRLSQRLTFDVRNNFVLTSNPFDALRANSELQQLPVLDQPNSTLSRAGSRRMEQAVATMSYALDAHSTIGLGGNFMHLINRERPATSTDDSQTSISQSGHVFYNRQLGPRSSTGFRYTFQKLDFDHGFVRTNSHTLLYLVNVAITPGLAVSAFAGPSYSDTRNLSAEILSLGSARSIQWTPAGGVTVGWTRPRGGLSLTAIRQIADGGGARGSVLLDSFSAQSNRQISRRSAIKGFVTYNRNHLLVPLTAVFDTFSYLAAGAGFERQLTQNCTFGISYWRVQQNDVVPSRNLVSGNRLTISLTYHSEKPLGRP